MTNISNFVFGGHNLRTVLIEGEPWFVAVDILKCLGMEIGKGTSNYYQKLDASEFSKVKRMHLGLSGGKPMVLVSESGLYKLIMRSDKKEARKFQDWVTQEVLPSIRKTGGYLLNETKRDTAHAADRLTAPGDMGLVWSKLDALTQQVADLTAALVALKDAPEASQRLDDLPEWLTARAVAEAMQILDPRVPAKAQIHVVTTLGVELTGYCRLHDFPIERVKRDARWYNRYPRDAVKAWLSRQRRIAA